MKLSLFYEITTPEPDAPGAESKAFKEAMEQITLADELGFHCVWEVEHHFLPGYSHSSCPELFLAAVSQRTKRIRLGHGIVQMPFEINNPVRVAERVATLDILSDGRVEFGAGRGTIPMEMAGFGVNPENTREDLIEALQMLPKMWTQQVFSWDGKIKVPPRQIVPKPVQKPHPPIWMAATQPWSVQFAAEHGIGLLGFGIGDKEKDDLIRNYKQTIKTCTPVGAFVNDKFALMRVALAADTDEEALAIQGPNIKLFYEQLEAVNTNWQFTEAPRTYEYASERSKRLKSEDVKPEDLVKGGGAVIGSVKTCLDTLENLAESGVDEMILFMQGGTTPHESVLRSIRLFGEQIIPRFQ